jgi:hypothetical protein
MSSYSDYLIGSFLSFSRRVLAQRYESFTRKMNHGERSERVVASPSRSGGQMSGKATYQALTSIRDKFGLRFLRG